LKRDRAALRLVAMEGSDHFGPGHPTRLRPRRCAVLIAAIVISGPVALAVTTPSYSSTLQKVPMSGFAWVPPGGAEAGKTIKYLPTYGVSRTIPLRIKYVKPAAVTAVRASPKPTRWVNGNPTWKFKKVRAGGYRTITLWLTFADGLQNGQRVREHFVFTSPGYKPYGWTIVQTVAN
jgi:hypothetical protein